MRSFVTILCLVLTLICLTTTLSACKTGGDEVESPDALEEPPSSEEADTLSPQSSAKPAPTATPEPIVYVDPKFYEYKKEISSSLDAGFMYPSHWIKETGQSTLVYRMPVNEGEIPARVALTTKKAPGVPSTEKMAEVIDEFTAIISKQYADFTASEIFQDVEFMKRVAFSRSYTATLRGVPIKGFIIITCNTKKKNLYVMHFYSPASEYDALSVVRDTLVSNVVVLSK